MVVGKQKGSNLETTKYYMDGPTVVTSSETCY